MEVGSVSRLSGPALVFNLSVEAPHTYFTGSEQLFSHNKVADWLLKVVRNHYDEGIATLHALQHLGKCGGRLGGPMHRGTVRELGDKAGDMLVAGGGRSERAVPVAGGSRIRFPDVMVDLGGKRRGYINVGRTRRDGLPVGREWVALNDLAATGRPTYFIPFGLPGYHIPWTPSGPGPLTPGLPFGWR